MSTLRGENVEVSVVRRRVQQTIEQAHRAAAGRRQRADEAAKHYAAFLDQVAVPLFRQVANVLKVQNYHFTVFTPGGSVRLMSDRSANDFIEVSLDTSSHEPRIVGHVSYERGRRVVDSERTIGTAVETLTEDALLDFLLEELGQFVER
jgi:hypothetical protein